MKPKRPIFRPELTFDEANERISSPAKEGKSIRMSGNSDRSTTGPAAAPITDKKRNMEAIEEEPARVPPTEVTQEGVKVRHGRGVFME